LPEVRAYIAFGGNLGDCHTAFINARRGMVERDVSVVASSPLYVTQSVGGPVGQPDYLNAVVEVKTHLSAMQLLELCLELENMAGRQRLQHWGARTLDLDLLLYGQEICNSERLMLPHPRLQLRRFVLEPLCALAGEQLHPLLGRSYNELLYASDDIQLQRVNLSELTW